MGPILKAFLEKYKKEQTTLNITLYGGGKPLSFGKILDYDEDYVLCQGEDSSGNPSEFAINVHYIYYLFPKYKPKEADEKFGNLMAELMQTPQNKPFAFIKEPTPEENPLLNSLPPIKLVLGSNFSPNQFPEFTEKLIVRIRSVRKKIKEELGFIMPGVKFRNDGDLKNNAYSIQIRGSEMTQGEVICFTESGFSIDYSTEVLSEEIEMIVRSHAAEILDLQYAHSFIENIEETYRTLAKKIIPNLMSWVNFQKTLQNLLQEKISIQEIGTILKTIEDFVSIQMTDDPILLTEIIRQTLSEKICKNYGDKEGFIHVFTFSDVVTRKITDSVQKTKYGFFMTLEPEIAKKILKGIETRVKAGSQKKIRPIALCPPEARPWIRRLAEHSFPELAVLSYKEIAPGFSIHDWANPISLEEEEEKVLQESSACRSEK